MHEGTGLAPLAGSGWAGHDGAPNCPQHAEQEAGTAALLIADSSGAARAYTYDDLERRSNQVANWLAVHGVRRRQVVAVVLTQQIELWETTLAVLKLGAALAPIDPTLPDLQLADQVARAATGHVIASTQYVGRIDEVVPPEAVRIVVGAPRPGWRPYSAAALAVDSPPRSGTSSGPPDLDDLSARPPRDHAAAGVSTTALRRLMARLVSDAVLPTPSSGGWRDLYPGAHCSRCHTA